MDIPALCFEENEKINITEYTQICMLATEAAIYMMLDKVQNTAIEVSDTAADAAYGVGKKAGELLCVAKLKIRIAETQAQVNAALQELGELLYATHTGNPTDSEILLQKLQEVDALKAQIAGLEAQICREEAARTCPVCAAPVQEGDAYCRECGSKL